MAIGYDSDDFFGGNILKLHRSRIHLEIWDINAYGKK